MEGFDNMAKEKIKKYIYILLVIIGVVLIFLYFNKWHEVKEEEKYQNSYLVETNTISLEINNIEEINTVLSETPSYYFLYISYTGNEKIYNLEKDIKPLINEYNLQDNFYFLNVTEDMKNKDDYKEKIANKLNVDNIKKVPVILYFKDGKLINDNIYNAKDFKKVLENENIKDM